jgi:hypothetical protein
MTAESRGEPPAGSGRRCVADAMRLGVPDRVPVFCQLALGHYFLNAGIAPEAIWFSSEGFAEALVRLQRRYRFDGLLVNLPGRPPDLLDRVRRRRPGGTGLELEWPDGSVTRMPPDDNPSHHAPAGGALPRADFAASDPDRPAASTGVAGYLWNIYHAPAIAAASGTGWFSEVPDWFLATIDRVCLATAGEVSIHGEVFSPFTHFMELFGYEPALLALVEDPAKARAWLDRLGEPVVAWGLAQARRGVDAVLVSSAFAGGGFLSRRMYAEFVVPAERRVIGAIRTAGVPVYTHTCGRIGDRLDLMLATGTQGVDTLDPPPLGNVDLATAKRVLAGRAFIKGNLNAVALLEYQTPAQLEAAVRACLSAGSAGGGYILSTACSVAPRVEPWKLERLVPLAATYGRPTPPLTGAGIPAVLGS